MRSSFSNYGPIATLAAPGEEVISTYPGNRYAAGWGTSFSTPLVSGAVALLLQLNPQLNQQTAAKALSQADPLANQGLGAGELGCRKGFAVAGGKAGRVRTYEGYFAKVRHELTPDQMDKLATITPYVTGATIKDLVNEALITAILVRPGRHHLG